MAAPAGFRSFTAHAGIRDDTKDFACVVSDSPCTSAAVFTRSRFVGPSVVVSRAHAARGALRAVVAISKNANVATGEAGLRDAHEIAATAARRLGLDANEVLVATTGVIGRPLPMDLVRAQLDALPGALEPADFTAAAEAIMTTDTVAKVESAPVGNGAIVGIAKGVGMIEPNMATLLVFCFTDADVAQSTLDHVFRRVVERTFNCVSVDSDTSTSDTAAILANGLAGPCDLDEFEHALYGVCERLTKAIARDGEGATKLIEVTVEHARDERQAKAVAKAIVNSPLVKTAVAGSDPNWGRIAMAIGKCEDELDIDQEKVEIAIGGVEVYPPRRAVDLAAIEAHFRGDDVHIGVRLHTGEATARVWGCDLTAEYVRINAEYST